MKTYSEQAKEWERKELNRYLDSLDEYEEPDDSPYNDDYGYIWEQEEGKP